MKTRLLISILAATTGCSTPASAADEASPTWVTSVISAPRLQHRTFDSAAAKAKVSYHIYTPEVYDTEKDRRFPVLYWLHGAGGGLAGVPKLAAHFDAAIRAGKTPPMLVVFANGLATSMWCDSKDGKVPMETVVVKELVPHVDATFRTIASREGRLIEGFSMGGYGAARLGFKYHDVFSSVSILAGGPLDLEFKGPRATAKPEERERILQTVFGGDLAYLKVQSPWVLAERNAADVRNKTRVRMATGERDSTLDLNRKLSEHLQKLGILHIFTVPPGVDHNPMALLNALGEANWEFYRKACGTGSGTTPSSPLTRYLDEVFPRSSVTRNLAFRAGGGSTNESANLLLDLYEPAGDTALLRPAVVWVHGGGFYKGAKTDAPMATLTDRFARRGYVTASINYRLASRDAVDPGLPTYSRAALAQAVTNATQDARAALRWLCVNAAKFRIDKERIAIGGGSAGAFTSLHVAYTKRGKESGGPGDSWAIRAVVDFWGGLLDAKEMKAGGPPVLVIHGTTDKVVPFTFAEKLVGRAREVGVTCEFHPLDGEGHAAWLPMDRHIRWVAPFLYCHVVGKPRSQ